MPGRFTPWMTLVIAPGAFVTSFDALRSLDITGGKSPRLAWLWPGGSG